MQRIFRGRYTADTNESFVVFIVGMRINNVFSFSKWLPTLMAMPPMLRAVTNDAGSGYLGGEAFMYAGGVGSIQYWRSTDDLERFAGRARGPHLRAWEQFNKSVAKDGGVGIWHETYKVSAGAYEAIYVNMPRFGGVARI